MPKSFSGLWPSVSNIAPLATCDCYTINSLTDHTGNNALVLSNLHYDIVCFYTTNSISAHTPLLSFEGWLPLAITFQITLCYNLLGFSRYIDSSKHKPPHFEVGK